jgi:hypothetical protein
MDVAEADRLGGVGGKNEDKRGGQGKDGFHGQIDGANQWVIHVMERKKCSDD